MILGVGKSNSMVPANLVSGEDLLLRRRIFAITSHGGRISKTFRAAFIRALVPFMRAPRVT